MSHPIIDDLNWRHTVKQYDPSRKVSEQDLDILFEAMRLSASSITSQPRKEVSEGLNFIPPAPLFTK